MHLENIPTKISKLFLTGAALSFLTACASTKNTKSITLDEEKLTNISLKNESGIAIRYPIGFEMSSVDGSTDAEHYQEFYKIQQFHKFSLKGLGKTRSTGVTKEQISNIDDTVNYSISSGLAKTQLIAHAVYDNIKSSHPNSIVYLNPVILDLSPGKDAKSNCKTNRVQYMGDEQFIGKGEKFDDTFCYTVSDASYQKNITPASVYIDVVALNTPDFDRYWLSKNRSMGAELTPAITISKFSTLQKSSASNFHLNYEIIEGTKRQVGDGNPYKCYLMICKKGDGLIPSAVLSIGEDNEIVQWTDVKNGLKEISDYAYRRAQKANSLSQHIKDLDELKFESIPAVSFYRQGTEDIALEALNLEYRYLDGSSKRFHEEFVGNSFPKITELIEVEKPVMEELLKETKKAQALELGTALLGVGLAAGSISSGASSQANILAIEQTNNLMDFAFQKINNNLELSVFDISEKLLPSSDFSRNINLVYENKQFNLGQVRSLEDLRQKLREKL